MKYREVQKWILNNNSGKSSGKKTSRFEREWHDIQSGIAQAQAAEPPPELVRSTYIRCRNLLKKPEKEKVPKIIWGFFMLILVLTVWFLLPVSALFRKESLELSSLLAPLILITQNAVMLLFVPVILKKFRTAPFSAGNLRRI